MIEFCYFSPSSPSTLGQIQMISKDVTNVRLSVNLDIKKNPKPICKEQKMCMNKIFRISFTFFFCHRWKKNCVWENIYI